MNKILILVFCKIVSLNSQLLAQEALGEKVNEVTITFVRHGESQANFDNRERKKNGKLEIIGGHNLGTPLTRKGEEQAKEVGSYFAKEGVKFTAVYASTAIRAYKTAWLCLQEMNNQPQINFDADLLEWGRGDWEGKTRDIYEHALMSSNQTKWSFIPGSKIKGESQKMVSERMQAWVKKIVHEFCQKPGEQHILAVTHGGAMRFFLHGFIGDTHEGIHEMENPMNTGMVRLIFRNGTLFEVQVKNEEQQFETVPAKMRKEELLNANS